MCKYDTWRHDLVVDLPVLGLYLDLRVFSNLSDAMIQNGVFQNPSPLYKIPKFGAFFGEGRKANLQLQDRAINYNTKPDRNMVQNPKISSWHFYSEFNFKIVSVSQENILISSTDIVWWYYLLLKFCNSSVRAILLF